jgi:hypothetical protein
MSFTAGTAPASRELSGEAHAQVNPPERVANLQDCHSKFARQALSLAPGRNRAVSGTLVNERHGHFAQISFCDVAAKFPAVHWNQELKCRRYSKWAANLQPGAVCISLRDDAIDDCGFVVKDDLTDFEAAHDFVVAPGFAMEM